MMIPPSAFTGVTRFLDTLGVSLSPEYDGETIYWSFVVQEHSLPCWISIFDCNGCKTIEASFRIGTVLTPSNFRSELKALSLDFKDHIRVSNPIGDLVEVGFSIDASTFSQVGSLELLNELLFQATRHRRELTNLKLIEPTRWQELTYAN